MNNETKFTKKMEIGIATDDSPFCIDGFCNVDGGRFEVCSVWGVDDDTVACEQSKANAHLIAATPEMYEMLETIMNILNGDDALNEVSASDIDKLLVKARGEVQ